MTHGATFFSAAAGAPWDDAAALARVLQVELAPESVTLTAEHTRALWKKLSYLGSNDLAYLLRGFEGVDYPEIVRDVCKRLRIRELQPGDEERAVEHNEQLVLGKIFADSWQHLDTDQRRVLLRELNLDEGHLPLSGAGVASAVLAGKAGPFAVYRLSLIVANSVERALPARGLAPARRKTAQAVALVASLRQAQRTALAATALAAPEPAAELRAARPGKTRQSTQGKVRRAARARVASPARQPRAAKKAASKKAARAREAAPKGAAPKPGGEKAPRKSGKKIAKKKKVARKKR